MKKLIVLVFLIPLLAVHALAQEWVIKGRVANKNDEPLSGVNVVVENEQIGAQTNDEGFFRINNVKKKNVRLVFSHLGYRLEKIPVENSKQGTILSDVFLQEESKNLEEVTVKHERKNKFTEIQSEYVAKLPLRNLENPQVYNTVTAELLKEQSVSNFDDALKNIPGMQKLWESTGRGGDGAGYYSMRGFSFQPTLMNGLPALTHGSPDPANIESIEAIKGPSGTLYGSSLISYGGLINIVTKKPYEKLGGEIAYLSGSYGLNRITADINTPLDSEHLTLLRVTSAYHTESSFQDAGFKKSFFVAPTLSYKASDKLSFLVVTEIMQGEQTNPTMLFLDRSAALTYTSMKDYPYDPQRSYTSNDLSIKNPTLNIQAQVNYKISNAWSSQTAFSSSRTKSEGYYSYIYEVTRYYKSYLTEGAVFNRYLSKQNATYNVIDVQQNFTGDFKLGFVRNRVLIGADYMQREYIDNSTGYVKNGTIYMGNDDSSTVYAVLYGGKTVSNYDSGILSRPGMDALLATTTVNNSKTTEKTFGAYVSDVINFTPALSVMASLRYDRFEGDPDNDDDDQSAFSPKFGIIYQPVLNRLSLFANYMDGFSNVEASQVSDADGSNTRTKSFKPEHASQYEFGIKTNLLDNKLAATLSYYNIKVSNKVMTDPDNVYNYIQDGEVESKGLEFDIVTNPIPGLNAVIGYSHNNSEIVKASSNVGTRPLAAGPENTFNFWGSYKLGVRTGLNGLGLGFGLNYIGESLAINYDATGDFTFSSYTILNAAMFYERPHYRMALKMDNLTDLEYYTGWTTINPQRPRTFSLNLAFRF
jgi:iron complex outermembrane recepter protein